MELIDTLEALCALDAVSGFERQAAEQVAGMLRPYCDTVQVDRVGNVAGFISCGKKNAKTILLDAHLDQIGFMVTEVLEGGFLRFTEVGGVDPRMLLGNEVRILADTPLYGVISSTPPHLLKAGEQNKAVPMEEMLIDTGLENAAEVIRIGTPVVFAQPSFQMTQESITSRSLDDRAGIASIFYALDRWKTEKKKNVNVSVLISVQEEVTGLGASAGAFSAQPDFGIAVDVSHAKTPDAPAGVFEFGGGVLVGMGPNMHSGLTARLIETAKSQDISYQLEVMEGNTGTNAWTMQIVAGGIAMGLLSIPLRYMHTPIETIKISDLEATGDLLYQFLRRFDGEVQQ